MPNFPCRSFRAAAGLVRAGKSGLDMLKVVRDHPAAKAALRQATGTPLKKEEMARVQAFLRKRLGNDKLEVRPRPKKTDSAEVYIGPKDEDFIAVLYREEEDGEISYQFQMAIIELDLEDMGL